MMKRLLFLFCLMTAPVVSALAQTADEFYHRGAQTYIDGRLGYALEDVEQGLRLHPRHPRLLALRQKIEEALQQRQQQRPPDQDEQAGDEDQQHADDAEENDRQQDELAPGEQDEEAPPQPGDDEMTDDITDADGRPGELPGEAPDQRMTRDQAERLLQATEQDEQELMRDAQRNRTRPRRVYPDW